MCNIILIGVFRSDRPQSLVYQGFQKSLLPSSSQKRNLPSPPTPSPAQFLLKYKGGIYWLASVDKQKNAKPVTKVTSFALVYYRNAGYWITIPERWGNDGSDFVSSNNRQAVPAGLFFPDSHASTVFTDTPINSAKITCVMPVLFRIFFISFAS